MSSLAGEDNSLENIFNTCINVSRDIAKEYLHLAYFDALVQNADRHNENLGFLRNKRSGRIVSLAPNFDNNVALNSTYEVLNEDRERFGMCKSFVDFLKSNKIALELFKELDLAEINDNLLEQCFFNTNIDVDKQNIKNSILNGYYLINKYALN